MREKNYQQREKERYFINTDSIGQFSNYGKTFAKGNKLRCKGDAVIILLQKRNGDLRRKEPSSMGNTSGRDPTFQTR